MAIRRSSQNWAIGQTVRVGFLRLRVIGFTPTPGDYRPDTYTLDAPSGQQYVFTPHYGLEKLDTPIPVPELCNPSAGAPGRLFRSE